VAYLTTAEVSHDVSQGTQEPPPQFSLIFEKKKKQCSVLSLPEIIQIFQVPLCEVFSGFIEQPFGRRNLKIRSPQSPDFTPLSLYFHNIILQHPVALCRSDFAFCFYVVYVQRRLSSGVQVIVINAVLFLLCNCLRLLLVMCVNQLFYYGFLELRVFALWFRWFVVYGCLEQPRATQCEFLATQGHRDVTKALLLPSLFDCNLIQNVRQPRRHDR
jgi:hypothetical protein